MADKKVISNPEPEKKVKTINLEDFYTQDNEANGMWYEPVIDGIPMGMEFLLIGVHSDEGVALMEHYDRKSKEAKKENDPKIRAKKEAEIDAERVASLVKGVRAVEGYELKKGDKKVDFSLPMVRDFLVNAPLVKMDLIGFAIKTANFMNRKKNR